MSSALFISRPLIALVASGAAVEQAEVLQVLGRDAERDGVADGLVEAVVGAVAGRGTAACCRRVVEVVPELVVDGDEVLLRVLDAHLDAQIVDAGRRPRRWRGRRLRGRAAS